jgi:hypothetical protein
MHVTLNHQQDREKSIMCVERDAHTCIILTYQEDELEQLVAIAKSMQVDEVLILTKPKTDACRKLIARGWESSDFTLLRKRKI